MELLPVVFMFTLIQANTLAQSRYEPFAEKPGSCAPALPVQICTRSCSSDSQCLGPGKCCPTSCGGYVCSKPVTMRQPNSKEKAGSCPAVPKGRWVCSPTCSVDRDCRGTMKCCKNRCGALACQKPDVEVIESIDIPVVTPPEVSYNEPRRPYNEPARPDNEPRNPSNEPRNPSNEPRNPYNEPRNPSNEPRNPSNEPRNPYNEPRNPYNEPRNPYNEPRNPYNEPRNPYNEPRYPYSVLRNPFNIPRNSFPGFFNVPNIYPFNYYNN